MPDLTRDQIHARLAELKEIKQSGAPMTLEGKVEVDGEIHSLYRKLELLRMKEDGERKDRMSMDKVANFETFPAVPEEPKKMDIDNVANFETFPALEDAKTTQSSSGGLSPMLLGVVGAVVLLVIAGVAMLRVSSPQTDAAAAAAAVPTTTSAANATAFGAGAGTYGPLKVTRGQGSSVSLYQLAATGPLPPNSVKWTLDAPCGAIAPLTASAQVSWSFDNNTKTCPPAGGPYPGTVKVTFTASDGKTYTWSAGSDTGTYGEVVTVR